MKLINTFSISLLTSITLCSCSLMPASGPNQRKILDLNNTQTNTTPSVDVIDLNDHETSKLFNRNQAQSFTQFRQQTSNYADIINVGDTLDVLIWEAAPAILFGGALSQTGTGGSNLTSLPEQTVSRSGKITIPFLGPVSVRGKTPEQIQKDIAQSLSPLANKPQVIVRLNKNNSANVTVLRQGNSVRMPLTSQGERVLDAIAAVGGTTENLQDISVQLTREKEVRTLSLEKLASNPQENILLRSGDVVTLLNKPLSFIGLGALGVNKQVKFSANGLSLAEGIGQMGGLLDNRADPQGVFVFRYIPFSQLPHKDQSRWKSRGYSEGMNIPTVYRVNLLDAKSLFWLQQFPIQDKDIVYVSNAPLAEFQKFLRLVFSVTSPISGTINNINGINNL
ncbi:TPA: polysaccharide export protein [Pasteurella multocida]|uniref:CexD n=1 Tax=Pasteurella multocida TaxID=747 RepID=Q9L9L6_PASMD|nr:polysaccharide biosynthesis/export family protein [Pasteurella multocida]AAF67275.1 CexD [Pasteurella multocida]APB80304.1 sugar ABC transporter substrate-binding protein [Pasteurella multocida]KEP93077.1 sugar ABC transporter substrate-binding protein [Pasteurella multocida subsp. multocida VTCCBAA264]KEZ11530.1 sugar ABC transporter substrate-binding protein [Pasteurella multocida]KEZ11766.1 sugar ABC transporter substrate-binding protein [Pasteurella multocida]